MLEIDQSTLSAIITAVTSIITCLIGVSAGKRTADNPSARGIKERQLTELYVPMTRVLRRLSQQNTKECIDEMISIVDAAGAIVPPQISQAVESLSDGGVPAEADIAHTKRLVASYYNWTRRSLGYPYDPKQIKNSLTPVYERNTYIRLYVELTFFLIWLFSTMMTFDILFSDRVLSRIPATIFACLSFAGVIRVTLPLLPHSSKR